MYGIPEGSRELYIYRVSQVNPEGREVDLSWEQVERFGQTLRRIKMDHPDATLAEIRKMIANGEVDWDKLADLFESLDEWLTKGGFLPNPWADAERT